MQCFLFPGQGSQQRGMGRAQFDRIDEFRTAERDIDALLGYSVRRLCLEDPDRQLFSNTAYTQPCLYVVNALHYFSAKLDGKAASYVAGHSLGEYNALLAAGAFDLMTGLRLVKRRGELMAQAKNGAMAAVVGLTAERIKDLLQDKRLSALDIASYNSLTQVTVSGPAEEIKQARPLFEKAGAKAYMPLPVSAAFHSRYMVDASIEFENFLSPVALNAPRLTTISNVTGRPYPSQDAVSAMKSLLVKQIVNPVLWTQSILYLMDQGVSEFAELGPGNVLSRLKAQIAGEMESLKSSAVGLAGR